MIEKQFKKDYVPYFLGIIVPAAVSFLTIPVLKNLLGASAFGVYTYYASILIIINASFSGGVSQAIIRLQIEYQEKQIFYYQSLWLILLVSLAVAVPLFIYIQLSYNLFLFTALFILLIFLSNTYLSLLAITQSRFFSTISAISESVRCIIFIGLGFILVKNCTAQNSLLLLFIALATSYAAGCTFLFLSNKFSLKKIVFDFEAIKKTGKEIFKYGGYLVGWFFCMYSITMSSRFIIARHFGKESIGHFTASFDIINKSIIFLLSPVLLTLFPLIIKAFSEGEHIQVRSLIRRLTVIEVCLMCGCLVIFYFVGFPLISKVLKTPATAEYLWIDLQVICSTFIWQIAMLQHKYLELEKKTAVMLLFIFIALAASVGVDSYLISAFGLRYAAVGFIVGGVFYYLLVMYYNKKYLLK